MSNKKEISPTLNECQNVTTTSIGTLYNKSVSFDEYLYHASISRRLENRDQSNGNYTKSHSWIRRRLPRSSGDADSDAPVQSDQDNSSITQDERSLLARAQRNVAWGGIFYLITTDVFGPLTVPIEKRWALAQLGYVPGIVLYTILGALAAYGGYQLWVIFIHLDSYRYPIRSYGDLAYRVYGPWARHTVNVLQSLQLFFSVGILILANGQGISQLSSGTLCFVACCVIFTSAGFCVGQIRTLQRFQWLATISIVLNTMILIITMVIVTRSEPNYAGANAQTGVPFGPITTSIGLPDTSTSSARTIGLLQAIYSYGGGMLRSYLWSIYSMASSSVDGRTMIKTAKPKLGIWTYTYQGQFALLISSQGISIYAWQSVTNVLNIISSLILACLYGNIGIKTAYVNIGVELLGLPPVNHGKGRFIFASLVPLYWGLAFIVCAAIPNISNFSALIAAATVLHFSYTFPAILILGFRLKKDAILDNEHFDAQSGLVHHVDSGYRRWLRGVRKRLLLNSFDLMLCLGFIAFCVLGLRASIDLLRQVFSLSPNTTSFSCKAPI
ncbi:hypothetical protein DPV78_007009 [Talaromyces pinophilus]|nr:hypothetical protein DPV78_007009 [Talaromyces pinophilus]